ncbi:Rrf2 family transcriptional regulator [Apilactobacillus sp. TMW 2.2459]|uniref:RrF2 family transcriptional regulator n=1 Tax=Apilactobacillus xinyiensis TaxID=2841032 RepID=UPI00200E52D8|nr:Rrf2 family transcriptional regulator [Apilactobacillus xinyiensis]MCL0312288.1 Rrf2 family transcriptional regulator [Apilactobacillus xinyiensis]
MSYSKAFSQSISILSFIEIGSKNENCDYLSIKIISQKLNIPIPSVKRITGMLKKQNILKTKSGLDGGLALCRPPYDINLFDVFISIEGHEPLFKVYDEFNLNSFDKDKDRAKFVIDNEKKFFNNIENVMLNKLKKISLNDILDNK